MTYQAKKFDLSGLNGISDETLEIHFGLYNGYVNNTNLCNEIITDLMKKGELSPKEIPVYSEVKRRYGFEYNGMVLHEYYFGNLSKNGNTEPEKGSGFAKAVDAQYGSFANWKKDFLQSSKMRGIGWVITYQDGQGNLSNHWVSEHQDGNVAGYQPVLVMDMWEHAYMRDYKPAEKGKYVEAFFSNIDWNVVNERVAAKKVETV